MVAQKMCFAIFGNKNGMEIIITKNNVYQYAMALTARAATATDAYMQTAITADNFPMLDVYLAEAVSAAEGELRKKLAESHAIDMNLEEGTVVIRIKEQWRAEDAVNNLIESGVRLFLAYYVASKWLQASPASGLADVYGTTAATHLLTATEALNQKEKFRVDEADYTERNGEGNDMTREEGLRGDYTERNGEGNDMTRGSGTEGEYERRRRDNLLARPGARILPHEVVTVRSEECCCRQEPAVTKRAEHLITNP